jgi:protein-S-isoprenylcysteine O-methyltransferase Ste14
MFWFKDPFLWAFISMFAIVGTSQIVSGAKPGRHPLFGIIFVTIFTVGRVVLVLPFLPQPRLDVGGWNWIVGGIIFVFGLAFSFPAIKIRPFTAPDEKVVLRTTGFYAIVRNPIYFGEVLWCLGWSIMFRSMIGLALVPFWWASLLFITMIEERSLERVLGETYLAYKKKVQSRIIPGLPI